MAAPLEHAEAAGDRAVSGQPMVAGPQENALAAAVRGGHNALVDDLLRAGACPTQVDPATRDAPLHLASAFGHSGIVSSLLREGADKEQADS